MSSAPELYALQEIDLALDRAQARLAEIDSQLEESEELVSARALVEENRDAVRAQRARQSDLEDAVDDVRAKTTEVERRLYGGTIRNPKELEDLQADLKSLQAQLRKREDDLLGLLVEIEDAEDELTRVQAAHDRIEAQWRTDQAELLAERERLEPEVKLLQGQRAEQTPAIDDGSLRLYGLLRDRYAGRAVAKVERGMCGGCRITLPVSISQRARAGTTLVQCVSCERILVVT